MIWIFRFVPFTISIAFLTRDFAIYYLIETKAKPDLSCNKIHVVVKFQLTNFILFLSSNYRSEPFLYLGACFPDLGGSEFSRSGGSDFFRFAGYEFSRSEVWGLSFQDTCITYSMWKLDWQEPGPAPARTFFGKQNKMKNTCNSVAIIYWLVFYNSLTWFFLAFLMLPKAQNSSLLTGKSLCLFLRSPCQGSVNSLAIFITLANS